MSVCVVAGSVVVVTGRALGQVPGELSGRVTDVRTAQPIPGARVEIAGQADTAQSGGNGAFTLRGLEPRAYTLRVRALGYEPRDVDVEIRNGVVTRVDILLHPAVVALAPVTVSGGRDTTSSAATTFDRQAIAAAGKRDVGELLQTTPGIVITQTGGPESASYASIRGSEAADVLVLLDGVPLNSPITGEADLSRIPLDEVERVVVLTGARSARYGDRALAGVIDIQTRRPAREAEVELRTGAWGEDNAAVTVGDARPLGSSELGGTLSGDIRTVRGDFPYAIPAVRGGGTADRVNSDVTAGHLAAAGSLGDSTRHLGMRGSWEDLTRGLAGSIVQPSTTGRETELRDDISATGSTQPHAIGLTATAGFTHERATFVDPSPPFGTAYHDTVAANVLTASTVLSAGNATRSASVGADAREMEIASTTLTASAPQWQNLIGAFGEARWSHGFDPNTHVDATASARIDETSLISGATLSPRVETGASHGIWRASVSLGSAYAAPTLADEFFQEGVLVQPNPNLRPERTRDDLEGRLAMHGAALGPLILSVDAAAYRADVDGMILWLPDYRFVWSPSNYNVNRSGYEVSGTTVLPWYNVDITAGLNETDVSYAGPVLTGQVAYRPRTTGTVTADVGPQVARIEVVNQYVGSRRTTPGSALNLLDPYWRTDVRVTSSHQLARWHADVTVAMDNAFDHPADMLIDYPFPGRSWSVTLRLKQGREGDGL